MATIVANLRLWWLAGSVRPSWTALICSVSRIMAFINFQLQVAKDTAICPHNGNKINFNRKVEAYPWKENYRRWSRNVSSWKKCQSMSHFKAFPILTKTYETVLSRDGSELHSMVSCQLWIHCRERKHGGNANVPMGSKYTKKDKRIRLEKHELVCPGRENAMKSSDCWNVEFLRCIQCIDFIALGNCITLPKESR